MGRTAAVLLLFATTACANTGRLGEYDFRDRSVAVVTIAPPRPALLDDWWDADVPTDQGFLAAVAFVGTEIVKDRQMDRAMARVDSAVATVDVSARMSDRVLRRAAAQLRARAVESVDHADFEVELRVKRYGIEADAWDAPARFFVDAEVRILEGPTGLEIWKQRVVERDDIAPAEAEWLLGSTLGNVVTAASLADLSVSEIEWTLEYLADYSADRMMEKLTRGLEKARR